MTSQQYILPLRDFQRIANAASGIITAERGQLVGKCVLFGLMGERLLRSKYSLPDARAVVGAFSVCVAPSKVIAFAGYQGATGNRQKFHCWVEAGGFVFDFSSFLYPVLASNYLGSTCKPLMFQKRATQASQSINALQQPGDFYFSEDRALREITLDATLGVPATQDILEILESWYAAPPKKMHIIGMADGKGNTKPVRLHNAVLFGAW